MGAENFTCAECRRTWPYDAVDKVPCQKRRKCICGECANPSFTHFGGSTYDPALDNARLGPQQLAVNRFMADLQWHTPTEIMASGIKGTDSSITARLRDIRKEFPAYAAVERRRKPGAESSGIHEYRVTIPAEWLLRWGSKRRAA